MKIKYIIPIIILTIASCNRDEVDTSPPTIEVLEYKPEPREDEICGSIEPVVFELVGGEEIHFNLMFTDDNNLSEYKVDIHNNFDCHGHRGGVAPKIAVPNVESQTVDWSVLSIEQLSGTSATIDETLKVPQNVTAGNYHFHIQVIDDAGNDSPFSSFYSIKVSNSLDDIPPKIHVEYPKESFFTLKKGETIRFVGTVTDNRSLSDGGNGILYLAYTDLKTGNSFTTDTYIVFEDNVDTTYDFDFEYTIPKTLVAGNYRLSLGANDGVRNVGSFIFFETEVAN